MDCQWARVRIPACVDGELEEREASRLRRHLAGCPSCSAAAATEEQFVQRLRAAAGSEPAPRDMVERISALVGRIATPPTAPVITRKRPRRRSVTRWAVAALVAAVFLLLVAGPWPGSIPGLAPALAAEHHEHVDGHGYRGLEITSADPAELEKYLTEKLGTKIHIPEGHLPKALGACLCTCGDRCMGVVAYYCSQRKAAISLFIIPAKGLSLSGLDKLQSKGGAFYCGSADKCNIVLWERNGLYYALVAKLSHKELLKIAESCS